MIPIANIIAREVLDSRGNPTVEVDVRCADGSFGRGVVPSGASTGKSEAHEMRDGEMSRYDGRGVLSAIENINEWIAPKLLDRDAADQASIDRAMLELDGTDQKTRLGANSLLGVSLAMAHAAAAAKKCPLFVHLKELFDAVCAESEDPIPTQAASIPLPMTNMISGGKHAGGNLDFQDYLISPTGAPDYATSLEWIVRVYRRLGESLKQRGFEANLVGDEGGYGPRLGSNRDAAELLVQAIESAGLTPGDDVTIALDVAASHFFRGEHYHLSATGNEKLTSGDIINMLDEMVGQFPIVSIEDGLAEEDWTGWRALMDRLGDQTQIIGDDLITTNAKRLRMAIEKQAANSVLIKPNQIGTLTETFETVALAKSTGFGVVVSARSGETEDTTIADLAVAVSADQIKIGSIVRSERLAKYNQLLRIEQQLDGV